MFWKIENTGGDNWRGHLRRVLRGIAPPRKEGSGGAASPQVPPSLLSANVALWSFLIVLKKFQLLGICARPPSLRSLGDGRSRRNRERLRICEFNELSIFGRVELGFVSESHTGFSNIAKGAEY